MALIKLMKTKRRSKNDNLPTVSQIVQTRDENGRDVLGFTVQYSEDGFYNVIRTFTNETYAIVYESLNEERMKLQTNGKLKEKKK